MRVDKRKNIISEKVKKSYSLWNSFCFTTYNWLIFELIYKKLVTVGKILKRSLKWDQPGIFTYFRLIFTSKIRTIVKRYCHEKIATKLRRAITPLNLQRLYRSMPWQTQAIIDAGGAHTSYWNKILAFVCCIWSSYQTYLLTAAFLSAKIVPASTS